MNTKTFLLYCCLFTATTLQAQQKWFTVFTDSAKLLKTANPITNQFKKDIKKLQPNIRFNTDNIINTSPYLIYYGLNDHVNLPLWSQVIPPIKQFFTGVGGSPQEGEKIFGLFFNGFYLIHEYGHALQYMVDSAHTQLGYSNEYLANTIAILWWRKNGKQAQLKACYDYAKKIYKQLPNPVPAGEDVATYFTKNYEKAASDPNVYGFMQWGQFITIYEDKSLPNFDTYIKNYLKKL